MFLTWHDLWYSSYFIMYFLSAWENFHLKKTKLRNNMSKNNLGHWELARQKVKICFYVNL